MATASVTPYYNGGSGLVGYVGGAKTARFKFTVPATGANKLSFTTKRMDNNTPDDQSTWATAGIFRFIISTSATAYNGYCGTAGKACGAQTGTALSGSISQNLLPNTTYYLFIFPGSPSYCEWYINGLTGNAVTLSGTYAVASTVTADDGYFGDTIPIRLTRATTTVSHTVSVSCAGVTTQLLAQTDEWPENGLLEWMPTVPTYAPLITNAASAEATVTVETFNGSTSYGTSSTTIRVRFREEDVKPQPTAGWATVSAYNGASGDPAYGLSGFIQGYSRAEASFDASKITLVSGATIAGYRFEALGETVTESPYRSGVLADGATVVCTVIDSRGFSAAENFAVTVLPYRLPTVSGNVSRYNSDQSGLPEDGNGLSIHATATMAALGGQNQVSVRYWTRPMSGSYSGAGEALTIQSTQGETAETETRILSSGFSPDTSWEVRLRVTDSLGNSAETLIKLPTRQWAMKFRADGQGVAFGKAPEYGNALELPAGWTLMIGQRTLIDLIYPIGSIYMSTNNVSPAGYLGGTWASVEGKFLLGATVETNDYPAGSTGGEAEHVLLRDELPAETVPLQVDMSGTPREVQLYNSNAGSGSIWPVATYGESGVAPITTEELGQGDAHNNMPPYLAVYVWKRTA